MTNMEKDDSVGGKNVALVVTSISRPNDILKALARGCQEHDYQFIVIGDAASPADFQLEGCRFYGLTEQKATGLALAALCPTKHYARKNLGYLLAIRTGATVIKETDDDNVPHKGFWRDRERRQSVKTLTHHGWTNVYKYFSESNLWPRGFPLDHVKDELPAYDSLEVKDNDCPIQQGLVNQNPDVDAVYRLICSLPQTFRIQGRVALGEGSWCPFNSQNTYWWPDAFPLMYLPAYCSFRMTDIWRSFVAQRIAWANSWSVLFEEPNVSQERNEHNLMSDFSYEVPGYLHNKSICEELQKLPLQSGVNNIGGNLQLCYEKLVGMKLVDRKELDLVAAWLSDLKAVRGDSATLSTREIKR